MAFITNVREFQAFLDACFSIQELELLIQSILIRGVVPNSTCSAVGTHRPRDTSK